MPEQDFEDINRSVRPLRSNTLDARITSRALARGISKIPIKDDAKKPMTTPAKKESPRSQNGVQVCRICLCDEVTYDNPLISPCKCDGTMKMIHIECLRSWLNSKCTIKDHNSVKTHCWKAMECELCK